MRLWEHPSSRNLGDDDDERDEDDVTTEMLITRLVLGEMGSLRAQMNGIDSRFQITCGFL